ncbi:LTA synthase family protein [Pseudopedobacter beijingensis]|uniref:LTA synthase family protein n=1 Tax=Pseudopedobacter beijingensis TaxID=1207056 RepID=A0ABW4I9Q2_9SPHI
MKKLFNGRFALLFSFITTYLIASFILRFVLYVSSFSNMDFSIISFVKIFGLGLFFDLGTAIFFVLTYSVYLLLLPSKLTGSILDKIVSFFIIILQLWIGIFATFSEFTFWDEFKTRFNFIAVDYLIYTYEVVENINQTYPIPLIVAFIIALIVGILLTYKKFGVFQNTFSTKTRLKNRAAYIAPLLIVAFVYIKFIKNSQAEWSSNLYESELSKNGVYSFFAAFRSNELDYNTFYATLPEQEAYQVIKKELIQPNEQYTNDIVDNIRRKVTSENNLNNPNIIMVTIESFSADFLERFGNKEQITPFYDSLANHSIFFTNMFATGTRTVRGMEALTLCVPPTPGNSIVRRPDNDNIFSIASVLKQRNYDLKFIYGGDGYFDNMNNFFGGQGFDIVDRYRGNPLSDNIKTTRYAIEDQDVSYENAWGICDEDIYKQSLKYADIQAKNNKPFFQFIMTTSNHKPYTFPENRIDLAPGNRESAVKYTDYALKQFINTARSKEWFTNTIFIIVADHCASSAGKWEINIDKHHIPAIVYNFNNEAKEVNKLVSQIDLMPTVFGLLKWDYETEFYGKDIFKMQPNEERAVIGNYRTLGLLKNNVFTEINDRKKIMQYKYENDTMSETQERNSDLEKLTLSYYQTASERFKNGKMKQK